MNPEQSKVRKIYTELSRQGFSFVGCWIGIAFFSLFHAFLFVVPIQQMPLDGGGESFRFWVMITGALIGYLRIRPFENYSENLKQRKFKAILKYYPIDRKEVQKMKLFYVVRIMAKVSLVSLLVQLYWSYTEGISWMNFVYVFVMSFVVPVVANAIYIHFEK